MRLKMKHAAQIAIIGSLAIFSIFTCDIWGPRDNPTDPNGTKYQGYETVSDVNSLLPASPTDGGKLSGQTVTVSKVAGAIAYQVRFATNEAGLTSATPIYSWTNTIDIGTSGLFNLTKYWWQSRAKGADGNWGTWCASANFTTAWTTPTATPTFSPAGGTFSSDQSVTISCATAGATIFYATNGIAPTASSTRYSGSISVVGNGTTMTIKAIALATGYAASATGSASYAIDYSVAVPHYAVTYSGNGSTSGNVPLDLNSPYLQNATVIVLYNTGNLARTGYTYNGWNTKADGTGTAYSGGNTFAMGTANIYLYAAWSQTTYTLTPGTIVNGTMTPATTTAVNAGTATTVTATANSGYAFSTWTASPSANATFGNATSASTTVTLTGNATITPAFASVNLYFQTFSSNPLWVTSDLIRFYWDSVNSVFHANPININNGGNYAVIGLGVNMANRSFVLEYDIDILSCDYGCGVNLGLFGTALNSDDQGSYVDVVFCHGDGGYAVFSASRGTDNILHGYSTYAGTLFSVNTWYHVIMSFTATTGILSVNVKNGNAIVVSFSYACGPFSADMNRVGFSDKRSGVYQVPNAQASCSIDNVAFR